MKIMVSACLLGCACRYDGCSREDRRVKALADTHTLIPVCPEQLGGLPTPRPPAERQGERVVNRAGEDVTAQYAQGAREAARLYALLGCGMAVLKARSPSCGAYEVYDGTFSGRCIPGEGVCAAALREAGATVTDEEHLPDEF